jgi:uncharacterized protein YbaR (Trm112 family)
MSRIPEAIRALLVCPRCRGELTDVETSGGTALDCPNCALRYPIQDGIPVLLADRAKRIPE